MSPLSYMHTYKCYYSWDLIGFDNLMNIINFNGSYFFCLFADVLKYYIQCNSTSVSPFKKVSGTGLR